MSEENSMDLLTQAKTSFAHGDMTKAKELACRACDLNQNNSDGWLLLGKIFSQHQIFGQAIKYFNRAAKLAPSNVAIFIGLSNALYAAGRLEEAVSVGDKALELQPNNPDSWYLQATLYGTLENFSQAESCLRRYIELMPTNGPAYRSLGRMLQSQNRLDEALKNFQQALHYSPNLADAHNDAGIVLQEQGRITEAIAQYKEALRVNPNFIAAMVNIGGLLLSRDEKDDAQPYFESALTIDGSNMKAHSGLGSLLLERGEFDAAKEKFNKMLSIEPTNEEATAKIALLYERQGNYDEALNLLLPLIDEAIDVDTIYVFALVGSHLGREKQSIDMLEDAIENKTPTSAQIADIHFLLGKLYDNKGEYESAYKNFESGNSIKGKDFNFDDFHHTINTIITTYDRANLNKLASASLSPRQAIFIVGMPRSGTSLAEQILSVHPQVQAYGELTAIQRIAKQVQHICKTTEPFPSGVLQLTKENLDSFAQSYLAELPTAENGESFFTDKLPHNFILIGLIQQVFPNAKIIHCKRDARDTCLSCYSHDFEGDHLYAYDLKTLGEYYLAYQRLMSHWESTLTIPIYNLEYEQVIADKEQQIRRLLNFCDLEWDERCMEPHTVKRTVLTSSYDQVRQPIYSSSVGRWKHYEKQLQLLINTLQISESN